MPASLIPAGYLYKTVRARPEWLDASSGVIEVLSVSGCHSTMFADYVEHWKHNGYWLFDAPTHMHDIARQAEIDLSELTLFYYELYGDEFDDTTKTWSAIKPDGPVRVTLTGAKVLHGFDVVSFSQRNAPECSPLSCNNLSDVIPVNPQCLFPTLDEAEDAINKGLFEGGEPGPYRIIAVYTVTSTAAVP
jgi:hypothetical protein